MKYPDGIARLLLLLLLMMMMMMMTMMTTVKSQLDTSEDVQQELPERFHSDDSDLDDVKKFKIALTPAPDELPPDVAEKAAKGEADAEAVRQEAAKTKEKLWRKPMTTAKKHKLARPQAADTHVDQQHTVEAEEHQRKMEHEEQGPNRGIEKHQESSPVKLPIATYYGINVKITSRQLIDRLYYLSENINSIIDKLHANEICRFNQKYIKAIR